MTNIVDRAIAAVNFKTLATALTAADLIAAFKGPDPFTVFAPSDEAFTKVLKDKLDEMIIRKVATSTSITQELADELIIANMEVARKKKEKGERPAELVIAKVEKAKGVAELTIANKEILFRMKNEE